MDIAKYDKYNYSHLDTEKGIKLLPDGSDRNIEKLVANKIREYIDHHTRHGATFAGDKLENLHKYIEADQVTECSDYVNREIQDELFAWCIKCCRERLGFSQPFYIDEKIYVRINIPFDYASKGTSSHKVNSGYLSKIKDSLKGTKPKPHRLAAYNLKRPRATWSHGPHIDTWYGHSYTATNFWFSICGANKSSSMVLFPDMYKKNIPFDPSCMYATYDVALRNPVELSLENGENFIFNPELLHSTRLNTSDETRIVITLRVSEHEPQFANDITHEIYDRWLVSEDLQNGNHLVRKVGTLISPPEYTPANIEKKITVSLDMSEDEIHNCTSLDRKKLGNTPSEVPFLLQLVDTTMLAVWYAEKLFLLSQNCPHIGAPLERGSVSNGTIRCPAHGVTFDLITGQSECKMLKIKSSTIKLD